MPLFNSPNENNSPFLEFIKLDNFMGFQHWESKLNDTTVIIGNNTKGKTSVLNGIQVALGVFLQCIGELPRKAVYRRKIQDDERFCKFDEFSKGYVYNKEKTKVFVRSSLKNPYGFELPLQWSQEYPDASRNQNRFADIQRYVDAILESRKPLKEDLVISEKNVLPVLLSFGTNRLSSQMRMRKETSERMTRIQKAYKAALTEKVDFASAHGWFLNAEKNIRSGREFEGTRQAFINALKTAIPYISEIDVDWAYGELEAVVNIDDQKSRHRFSQLSDGFKSMINLVAEISHRSIELNGFLGESAILKTPGVVLIDEIDLYLHPKWQRHVLADLKKAFPLVQFIVTTHSPFVIQSVPRESLIALDDELVGENNQMASLEDVAIKFMGMTENTRRSEKYNEMVRLATEYFEIIKNGRELTLEQEQRLNEIEAENSSDPAYVALLRAERTTR